MFGCCFSTINLLGNKINHQDPLHDKFKLTTSIRSTVALSALNEEGKMVFFCGGIFVGPTTIVTARHCVVDSAFYEYRKLLFANEVPSNFADEIKSNTIGKKITIVPHQNYNKTKIGQNMNIVEATVVYVRGDNLGDNLESDDLAILRVGKENASKYYVNVAKENPVIGERVYTIGMPHNIPFIVADGIISSENFLNGKRVHNIINVFVAPGSSGGPLLNSRGELIGIAHVAIMSSSDSQSNLGFYVVPSKIEEYLNTVRNENIRSNNTDK